MQRSPFGATGMIVSTIGVGCSRIGGVTSPGSSTKEEIALLQEAADLGVDFFDTADLYSQGKSEGIVGRALRRRRSEVVIATKGGYLVPGRRRLLAHVKPLVRPLAQRLGVRRARTGAGGGAIPQDFSPAHLSAAVEASLRRLRTDYIDVYQLHSPPRSIVDAGEYVGVLEHLRAQGKILHYGIAADDPADVRDFDRHPGIRSLQLPFNLLHQEGADEVLPKAAERGVAVIARSCYAAGLFKEGLPAATLRGVAPEWQEILRLRETARRIGRPLLEIALQFSLATESIAVTILGMRTRAQLRENLRLASARPLTREELAVLTTPACDSAFGRDE